MRLWILCVLTSAATCFAGCSGGREAGEADARTSDDPLAERFIPREFSDPGLAPSSTDIKTVQLYGEEETDLPIMQLATGRGLTLEFDLMSRQARPLSVYFYHADRSWRRDLLPTEYLQGFTYDEILEYQTSHASASDYVHYTYRFPNENIRFRLSGNYILRVAEQGAEHEVLFERAFFISEEAASPDLLVESIMLGIAAFPGTLPLVRFTPPQSIQGNAFDYDVCFVRNGRIERARCSDRPILASQPTLQFDLERHDAFYPEAADYFLDLSSLNVRRGIERTDLSTAPHQVVLEPDYANFPGTLGAPLLNGQTIVSDAAQNLGDADVFAEYVETRFSFVPPDEEPLEGELLLTGSFNDWQYDPSYRMEWVADARRYEGVFLLKQGLYEYRYFSPDRRLRRILSNAMPRTENLYLAFVYYSDMRVSTDRLLGVSGTLAP